MAGTSKPSALVVLLFVNLFLILTTEGREYYTYNEHSLKNVLNARGNVDNIYFNPMSQQRLLATDVKRQGMLPNLLKTKIADLYLTNLTEECERDFTRYQDELNKIFTAQWALRMADSDGKFSSGVIDGHTMFEGSYEECVAVKEPEDDPSVQEPIRGLYCLSTWYTPVPTDNRIVPYARGKGFCIPDTCNENDAEILLFSVYDPLVVEGNIVKTRCVYDLELNAEAIISIVILSLLAALVFIGTFYDWLWRRGNLYQIPAITQNNDSNHVNSAQCGFPRNVSCHNKDCENNTETKPTRNGMDSVHHYNDSATAKQNSGHVYINNSYARSTRTHASANSLEMNEVVVNDDKIEEEPVQRDTVIQVRDTPNEVIKKDDGNPQNTHLPSEDRAVAEPPKKGLIDKVFISFSMMVTLPVFLSAKPPPGMYKCLNGIRFLATMYVILGHTYRLGPWGPNWPENYLAVYVKSLNDWKMYKIIYLDVVVDTFLILSGFLVTTSFLRKLEKSKGKLTVGGMALHYFHRYWRLTPTYMIVLMIYTNLYHYFAKGPFMREYTLDIDRCSESWWSNLLYVNNIFPVDNAGSCMGWSWYLAVDMQMYIIAPLFIYVYYVNKAAGIVFTVAGFCGGLVANIVLYHEQYFPVEGEEPINNYQDIYIPTWTRCITYFMGIMLGYLFHDIGVKVRLHWVWVALGWIVATALHLMVSYLPYDTVANGDWTNWGWIIWNSFKRPMWGLAVCWLIWACSAGYGGFINTFLSWNFLFPLAKLSYAAYLIHPIFTYLYFDGSPTQIYATQYIMVYLVMANLLIVHLFAVVVSVFVTGPLTGVVAVFLPGK